MSEECKRSQVEKTSPALIRAAMLREHMRPNAKLELTPMARFATGVRQSLAKTRIEITEE
jgi:hypothetical protein